MNRRDAIKQVTLLTGYALSASAISGILNGCQPTGAPDWEPAFFSKEQGVIIADMAETILPRTDTPGAKDVFVHEYIDLIVKDCFKTEEQEAFKNGLDALAMNCQKTQGKAFPELSTEDQLTYLNKIDQGAKTSKGKPPFFIQFKQLVFAGYFTSQEVGTTVLGYDPIPAAYDGCITLEDGMPVWALR